MIETGGNKRIARNTIFLYIRQLFSLFVSLYTVRIVLNVLGVVDYGIYNVVGGIITMFSFLSSTMATSTQRYLSFELGKNRNISANKVFSMSLNIYVIIIGIFLFFAETIGLWFLNAKMNIPADRLVAANYVYQSAVFSFVIHIICTPYNASIISMERMNVFAYVGIADAILRLIVALLIPLFAFMDTLIAYAILLLLVTLLTQLIYVVYCKRKFTFCVYKHYYDKSLFKSMLSFAGWNVVGAISNVLRSQGINILINLFFSPAVNAARAIAYQINNAINNFSNNFYTAVRPQITKNYASGALQEMNSLIFMSSKLSFFIMLVLMLPISINGELILQLWLGKVPEYANIFLQFVLLNALIEVYSMPLVTGIQASGRIRTYQLIISVIYLLNLPVSYVFLRCGYPPQITVIVNIAFVVIAILPRLVICHRCYGLDVMNYLSSVLGRTLIVGCLSYAVCWKLNTVMTIENSIVSLILSCLSIFLVTCIIVLSIGLTRQERGKIIKTVCNRIKK